MRVINASKLHVNTVQSLPEIVTSSKKGECKYAYLLGKLELLPNGQMIEVIPESQEDLNVIKSTLDRYIKKNEISNIGTASRSGKLYIFNKVQ